MYSHIAYYHLHNIYTNTLNGLGGALTNDQGEFFCGFEQKDGTLAFAKYRQNPQSLSEEFEIAALPYDQDKPVFLSPQAMRERGVAAAVWPTVHDACVADNILPKALLQECRVVQVQKTVAGYDGKAVQKARDMGFSMQALAALPAPDFGLASWAACQHGQDQGYVSFGKSMRVWAAGLFPSLRR